MTVVEMSTPSSLAERLAAREASGLAELYDRHGRAAYNLALRVLGEQSLAEQAVERAFERAWGSAEPAGTTEAAWLLAIVHRESVAIARSQPHRAPRRAAPDSPALAALPPPERETIELVYYAAMTEAEVAEALGLSRQEVRARMVRALTHLRALQAASR
jgi:RNA polymerase sigma-70 factor (ECF subfamily)